MWKFPFFDLINSKSMESFQREGGNPAFVKMYLEVIPVMSILEIFCKLILRIFTTYTKENNKYLEVLFVKYIALDLMFAEINKCGPWRR